MNIIMNFMKLDVFLIILLTVQIILFILYFRNVYNLKKLRKSYSSFLNKLGNGNNIEEMLKSYITRVEKVDERNSEVIEYYKSLDNNLGNAIQKIGLVRYNAFRDTGSDLSFALALLDRTNSGIVLNGIYARDCSNIYAKPIENGKSKYILSNEEKEALEKAIENK